MSIHHDDPRSQIIRRGELLVLRRQLLRIQDEARLLRRDWLRQKYSPDQPRVPAGGAGGGQWTSGGGGGSGSASGEGFDEFAPDGGTVFDTSGNEAWASFNEGWSDDGTVFERDIVNRDGSTIQSEYAASRASGFDERQTVTLSSGEKVVFETTDRTQTIRAGGADGEIVGHTVWAPSGPERDATVQPVLDPLTLGPGAVVALGGAILFNWQSPFNGSDGQQAVMAFEAHDFRPSMPGAADLSFSGRVSQEEAEAVCKYLPEMQARLDNAVAKAGSPNDYRSPQAYGTFVHKELKDQIDAAGYRDLVAERSVFKEEAARREDSIARYGIAKTVRIDAVETRPDGTRCLYDFKTGERGMSDARFSVLGRAYYNDLPQITRAIVIQVRPKR